MQEFLDSLRKGEFKVPVCISCSAIAWPPSRFCSKCYSPTLLQKIKTSGILVEFANSNIKNKQGTFGLVNIDGIRLVGKIKCERPQIGITVEMAKCGIEDGSPFYDFA
jgi:uncharacterized OB-fold protein